MKQEEIPRTLTPEGKGVAFTLLPEEGVKLTQKNSLFHSETGFDEFFSLKDQKIDEDSALRLLISICERIEKNAKNILNTPEATKTQYQKRIQHYILHMGRLEKFLKRYNHLSDTVRNTIEQIQTVLISSIEKLSAVEKDLPKDEKDEDENKDTNSKQENKPKEDASVSEKKEGLEKFTINTFDELSTFLTKELTKEKTHIEEDNGEDILSQVEAIVKKEFEKTTDENAVGERLKYEKTLAEFIKKTNKKTILEKGGIGEALEHQKNKKNKLHLIRRLNELFREYAAEVHGEHIKSFDDLESYIKNTFSKRDYTPARKQQFILEDIKNLITREYSNAEKDEQKLKVFRKKVLTFVDMLHPIAGFRITHEGVKLFGRHLKDKEPATREAKTAFLFAFDEIITPFLQATLPPEDIEPDTVQENANRTSNTPDDLLPLDSLRIETVQDVVGFLSDELKNSHIGKEDILPLIRDIRTVLNKNISNKSTEDLEEILGDINTITESLHAKFGFNRESDVGSKLNNTEPYKKAFLESLYGLLKRTKEKLEKHIKNKTAKPVTTPTPTKTKTLETLTVKDIESLTSVDTVVVFLSQKLNTVNLSDQQKIPLQRKIRNILQDEVSRLEHEGDLKQIKSFNRKIENLEQDLNDDFGFSLSDTSTIGIKQPEKEAEKAFLVNFASNLSKIKERISSLQAGKEEGVKAEKKTKTEVDKPSNNTEQEVDTETEEEARLKTIVYFNETVASEDITRDEKFNTWLYSMARKNESHNLYPKTLMLRKNEGFVLYPKTLQERYAEYVENTKILEPIEKLLKDEKIFAQTFALFKTKEEKDFAKEEKMREFHWSLLYNKEETLKDIESILDTQKRFQDFENTISDLEKQAQELIAAKKDSSVVFTGERALEIVAGPEEAEKRKIHAVKYTLQDMRDNYLFYRGGLKVKDSDVDERTMYRLYRKYGGKGKRVYQGIGSGLKAKLSLAFRVGEPENENYDDMKNFLDTVRMLKEFMLIPSDTVSETEAETNMRAVQTKFNAIQTQVNTQRKTVAAAIQELYPVEKDSLMKIFKMCVHMEGKKTDQQEEARKQLTESDETHNLVQEEIKKTRNDLMATKHLTQARIEGHDSDREKFFIQVNQELVFQKIDRITKDIRKNKKNIAKLDAIAAELETIQNPEAENTPYENLIAYRRAALELSQAYVGIFAEKKELRPFAMKTVAFYQRIMSSSESEIPTEKKKEYITTAISIFKEALTKTKEGETLKKISLTSIIERFEEFVQRLN